MILGSPTLLAVALLSEYQSPFLSPRTLAVPLPPPVLSCFEAENTMPTLAAHRLRGHL